MFSTRKSIYDLEGYFVQYGGGYEFLINLGLDVSMDSIGFHAIQMNFGVGISPFLGEGHNLVGYSWLFPLNERKN